jgi:hypothetical protein
MNLPDSWGSHQPEPQLQEVLNRRRMPTKFNFIIVIIIHTTASARRSLAITSHGTRSPLQGTVIALCALFVFWE